MTMRLVVPTLRPAAQQYQAFAVSRGRQLRNLG
jgi:hypothetical protein